MRFAVVKDKLDKDHPCWPNEEFYRVKDSQSGFLSFSCYKKEEHAEESAKKRNEELPQKRLSKHSSGV